MLHFHAHPEVDTSLDMGGQAASLRLPGGQVWVLRADGADEVTVRDALHLERGRLQPRATQVVVVSFVVDEYESAVNWTLTRAD